MTQETKVDQVQPDKTQSLIVRVAERYSVPAKGLLNTLRETAFKTGGRNAQPVSDAQSMQLLIVADQHKLNPFTREIFAFPAKNGDIIPIVSVDGWVRILNEHALYDGVEFRYSDQMVTMPGSKACFEWVEVIIYHKDRSKPTVIREFLDETYQPPRGGHAGAWQSHPKRMLRHKAFIQGARVAFGFAGIYDLDEAERIRDMGEAQIVHPTGLPSDSVASDGAVIEATEATEATEAVEAEVVYPEISQSQKDGLSAMLNKLVERASMSNQWAAAQDYLESKLSEGELQYAMGIVREAEESFYEQSMQEQAS